MHTLFVRVFSGALNTIQLQLRSSIIKRLQELDLFQYRRFLVVVPQTTLLFSGTVRENITYGLNRGKR